MDIGSKLRELRAAKCMTQAQLAGELITRNMLSRIENGAATPSLTTVAYLAERLHVPVGYLLSDGEEERFYRKLSSLENIKHALRNGDFAICRDLCRALDPDDDEVRLLLALSTAGLAREDFFCGRLRASMRHFDEAREHDALTLYSSGTVSAQAVIYQRYMHRISATLMTDITDEKAGHVTVPNDRICDYILTLEEAEAHPETPVRALLERAGMDISSPLSIHILAHDALRDRDYAGARRMLSRILNMQERIPDPILYNVFYELEICSKETNDYRSAYEYSTDKVNLLERMLTETEEL